MKNLVTVLLIATLAIASSVAAQEIPQAKFAADPPAPAVASKETTVDAVDAPAPAVESKKTTVDAADAPAPAVESKKTTVDAADTSAPAVPSDDTANTANFWQNKHCDDKKCAIITLNNPQCVLQCKVKCGSSEACNHACKNECKQKCEGACEFGEDRCQNKCHKDGCIGLCRTHRMDCDEQCDTDAAACDRTLSCPTTGKSLTECLKAFPLLPRGACVSTCAQRTKEKCSDYCSKRNGDPAKCRLFCEANPTGCICDIAEDQRHKACETSEQECVIACGLSVTKCNRACKFGRYGCNKKCQSTWPAKDDLNAVSDQQYTWPANADVDAVSDQLETTAPAPDPM